MKCLTTLRRTCTGSAESLNRRDDWPWTTYKPCQNYDFLSMYDIIFTTSDSKLFSLNVSESSVTTPDLTPLPTCTTFYTSSPSPFSPTALLTNFSLKAPHTPTPQLYFVNKTSLMQFLGIYCTLVISTCFGYYVHPSSGAQLCSTSWNSTPNDTLHAHIYCTFPPVHNCAPEDGWT